MEDKTQCRNCGAEMPAAGSPEGLCSKCLLQQALNHGAEGNAATKKVSDNAPPIEEIGPEFPQLDILELVGVGGMGAVYRARQRNLDRIVALKVVSSKVQDDPSFAERFTREARALAKLNHPNIVAVYDFGQAPGGRYFFIMEFVDGVNLRDTIRSGRLKPEEALAIVPRICDALQYAHDEGVVHRDIKPENILVDLKGRIKIADFGLAKLVAPGAQEFTLTGTRDIMGTPHYMAPEQIEHPLQVDHRADIYALGVVLYEMLTGELPLGRFAPPSHKVHVDVRLDEIVLRTLEREPERRYQQASQLKTDVESVSRPDNFTKETRRRGGKDPTGQRISAFMGGLIALAAVMLPVLLILAQNWKPFQAKNRETYKDTLPPPLTGRPGTRGVTTEPVVVEPITWGGTVDSTPAETETSGPNLLLNAGFEEVAAGDPRRPMHWTPFSDFPTTQAHAVRAIEGDKVMDLLPRIPRRGVESIKPYSGAAAALVTIQSNGNGTRAGLRQELSGVGPGDTLIIGGYAMGGGSSTPTTWQLPGICLETINRDDMITRSYPTQTVTLMGAYWPFMSTIVRIPENSTASIVLSMNGQGTALFDELLVQKAAEPQDPANFILNGGFENVANGEIVAWTQNSIGQSDVYLKPDTNEKHSGRRSITVARSNPGTAPVGWRHYASRIPPGGLKKLSGYVKAIQGSNVKVAVVVDTPGGSSTPYSKSIWGNGDWQKVEIPCLVSQDKMVWIDLSLAAGGQAWFDDFRLE